MSEANRNPPPKPDAAKQADAAAVPAASAPEEARLGAFLTAARERRGASRDEAIAQTRIPAHYIRMIESDNYSAISDQLYVLPFIRRYAQFLGLDPEEIAIRFVREVQRAESNVIRISQPIVERRRRSRGHLWLLATGAILLAIAAGLYLRRNRLSVSALPLISPPAASVEPSPAAASDAAQLPRPIAPPASRAAGTVGRAAPAPGGPVSQPPRAGEPAPPRGPASP
jgi:cytoskeletal protein RodZ